MITYIVDVEANSLDPDKIWCIILKEFKEPKGIIFCDNRDSNFAGLHPGYTWRKIDEFKTFANNSSGRFVGHNFIDFDCYALNKVLGVDLLKSPKHSQNAGERSEQGWQIRDTLIMSRLTDVMRPGGHSVEAWGIRFGIQKVSVDDEQWSVWSPLMLERCMTDVLIQEKIYDHLRSVEMRGFSLQTLELEQDVQELISKQRRDGVKIDVPLVHSLFVETKTGADQIEREVQHVFPPKATFIREYTPKVLKDGTVSTRMLGGINPSGSFSSICFEPFNLDSPVQRVSRLLELGWKPTRFTKSSKTHPKGQPKFDEDALDDLPEDAPKEIKLLGTYLMLRSKQRTFNQWLDGVDKNGLLHGSINTLGARTHRMSHTDPNLGNIAAVDYDKETKEALIGIRGRFGWESRSCFTAEDTQRNTLVDADADGIQLRGVAHYAGDPGYITLISDPKYDPHQTHADVLECIRSVAKTFIYAWILGAGIGKVAQILGCSVGEAKSRMEVFYQRFPFLKELKEWALTQGEKGYIIALDGRPIKVVQGQEYKSLAYFLQSFERIVMAKAMVEYQKWLTAEGVWFRQRLIVHDEFLTETRRETAEYVGKSMSQNIVKAGEFFNSKCPLASKFKTGTTWAEVH